MTKEQGGKIMSTKHTPGPWFIVTSDHNVIVDKDPALDGRIVARTYDNRWQSRNVYDEDGAEGIANAHLIAAAPDLFEALENCAEWIKRHSPADDWPLCWTKAGAALAKASGDRYMDAGFAIY